MPLKILLTDENDVVLKEPDGTDIEPIILTDEQVTMFQAVADEQGITFEDAFIKGIKETIERQLSDE